MLYFAYGSNLHPARLAARVSSVSLVTTGFCPRRQLAFHKIGQDGSAKCDLPAAPTPDARVYGALFEMGLPETQKLDRVEGVGAGYERALLSVVTESGPVEAFAYVAQERYIDTTLKPFHWYKTLVAAGARHHGFHEDYVASISAFCSIPDPRRDRAAANLGVIASGGKLD